MSLQIRLTLGAGLGDVGKDTHILMKKGASKRVVPKDQAAKMREQGWTNAGSRSVEALGARPPGGHKTTQRKRVIYTKKKGDAAAQRVRDRQDRTEAKSGAFRMKATKTTQNASKAWSGAHKRASLSAKKKKHRRGYVK